MAESSEPGWATRLVKQVEGLREENARLKRENLQLQDAVAIAKAERWQAQEDLRKQQEKDDSDGA